MDETSNKPHPEANLFLYLPLSFFRCFVYQYSVSPWQGFWARYGVRQLDRQVLLGRPWCQLHPGPVIHPHLPCSHLGAHSAPSSPPPYCLPQTHSSHWGQCQAQNLPMKVPPPGVRIINVSTNVLVVITQPQLICSSASRSWSYPLSSVVRKY